MNPTTRTALAALVLAAALVAGQTAWAGGPAYLEAPPGATFERGGHYVQSIDMMFDVLEGGELSLGTTNGSVRVNTWPRDQIRLVITKTVDTPDPYNARTILEDFLVQTRHKGKDLDLRAAAKSESCRRSVGVTFQVWVPRRYNVDIDTGDGNVDIGKITGAFSARTAHGKIKLECDPEGIDIEVEDRSGAGADETAAGGDAGREPEGAETGAGLDHRDSNNGATDGL